MYRTRGGLGGAVTIQIVTMGAINRQNLLSVYNWKQLRNVPGMNKWLQAREFRSFQHALKPSLRHCNWGMCDEVKSLAHFTVRVSWSGGPGESVFPDAVALNATETM